MSYCFQKLNTPVGQIYLVAKGSKITGLIFSANWPSFKKALGPVRDTKIRNTAIRETETPVLKQAKKQLQEYFKGSRRHFSLPYELVGTPFQKRVWKTLSKIPYGRTRSYKEQAKLAGSPKAARAVGRTNGLNPICIVLPCHRVIASDGSLAGFSSGLKVKKFLLEHESKYS